MVCAAIPCPNLHLFFTEITRKLQGLSYRKAYFVPKTFRNGLEVKRKQNITQECQLQLYHALIGMYFNRDHTKTFGYLEREGKISAKRASIQAAKNKKKEAICITSPFHFYSYAHRHLLHSSFYYNKM